MIRRHWKGFAAIFLAGMLLGCGTEATDTPNADTKVETDTTATDTGEGPERQVYVGAVDGTNALAAMVYEMGLVSFYVCGHGETLESHTRWFNGAPVGPMFNLNTEGWSTTGTVGGDTVTGHLQDPDGQDLNWTLHRVEAGLSHLYSAMHSDCRTGVIVVDDGREEPAVQGAWCNGEGLIKQVTPMLPLALTFDGLEISVDLDTGPVSFFVQPHEIPY